MNENLNRRSFVKQSFLASAGAALALGGNVSAQTDAKPAAPAPAAQGDALPKAKICDLTISRILLGGNLLTHYTHSRELKYVYKLTENYNTEAKILETLALAESHGINTLSMHNPPEPYKIIKKHRQQGGKMQWIICPTAEMDASLGKFNEMVQKLIDDGTDAIYIWGVRTDPLTKEGKVDIIAKAVDLVKAQKVPCGVGAHTLFAIQECERAKVNADFYIKTFHHHNYPSAPKPGQAGDDYRENPGYWCGKPKETAEFMKTVQKPWIAFKVMAAGAIPPENALQYAFENGADFCLFGMFDFEIAEDVALAKKVLAGDLSKRSRPWRA